MGPDLVFVILSMDKEEIRKRVKDRHHGDDKAVELMEVNQQKTLNNSKLIKYYDPAYQQAV